MPVEIFPHSLAELEKGRFLSSAPSRSRCLSSMKSLLAFGHRIGYLLFDVGRVLRLPAVKNTLAERILSESDLHRMLSLEPDERNRVRLLLLYTSGVRWDELAGLVWKNLPASEQGGQITGLRQGRQDTVHPVTELSLEAAAGVAGGKRGRRSWSFRPAKRASR